MYEASKKQPRLIYYWWIGIMNSILGLGSNLFYIV